MPTRRSTIWALTLLALPSAARAQAGWMHWPLERATAARVPLTQGYYGDYIAYCGSRDGCGTHSGYDIACARGTPVYAVAPGVVDAVNPNDVRTTDYGSAGLWVRVRHDGSAVPGLPRTYYTAYMHLSRIDVSPGAAVTTTTRLGLSGNTGGVGAHLHLHLSTTPNYCGGPVDPGCPTGTYVRGSVVPAGFVDAPGCQQVCRAVTIQWVQPAAYGNEPYAGTAAPGCGDLDYRGRCEGDTLRWCMAGAAMTANCADRNAVCAFQDPTEGFNCLRCDPSLMRPLLPGPRCEGTRYLRCEGTRALATDCAAMGMQCTPDGCITPPPPPPLDAGNTVDVGTDLGARDDGAPADAPRDDGGDDVAWWLDGGPIVAIDGAVTRDVTPTSGCACRGAPVSRGTSLAVFAALAAVCARRRSPRSGPRAPRV